MGAVNPVVHHHHHTTPGGLGTFGWDDEGVPAQRVPIVRDGMFCGYLTSRETAQQLREIVGDAAPQTSGGAMRADGWDHIPLIRMTNVNLEPGEWERALRIYRERFRNL